MIVIANGMLRSGSTLQYNLAADVLEASGQVEREGFLSDFAQPKVRARLDSLKGKPGWAILKTHNAPIERVFYDDRVRVLFSYRDVRDIAASMRKKWGFSFEKILADIDSMIELERAVGGLPNVLVQSYDYLYSDVAFATREIAQFLDVQLDDANVAYISEKNSIHAHFPTRARRSGRFSGLVKWFKWHAYDPKSLLHADHISATGGKDGDWKNQFTEGEIDVLHEHFGHWLVAHGYLNSTMERS